MQHAKHADLFTLNTINDDVIWVSHDFPTSGIPVTLSVQIGMICNRQDGLLQAFSHVSCSLDVALGDVLYDACQVSTGIKFPDDGQHQLF
jgi:hypothetical protein